MDPKQYSENLEQFKIKLVEFLTKIDSNLLTDIDSKVKDIAENFVASIDQKKKCKLYLLNKNSKLIRSIRLIDNFDTLFRSADKTTKNIIWSYLQLFYVLINTNSKDKDTRKYVKSLLTIIEFNASNGEDDNEESSDDDATLKINNFVSNITSTVTNGLASGGNMDISSISQQVMSSIMQNKDELSQLNVNDLMKFATSQFGQMGIDIDLNQMLANPQEMLGKLSGMVPPELMNDLEKSGKEIMDKHIEKKKDE